MTKLSVSLIGFIAFVEMFVLRLILFIPITTPSMLGPNAFPKSGWCIWADNMASSGRSRKHFISCECDSSGAQLTWCDTIAAYLAGSLTSDHGANPEPDSSIVRWNSNPRKYKSIYRNKRERETKKKNRWIVALKRASTNRRARKSEREIFLGQIAL